MRPKVSIVITAYSEKSSRYLDLCIESIKKLNYPQDRIEVLIVGRKDYLPGYDGCTSIAPDLKEFSNPVGINFGFKNASKDSQYLVYANDDVIFTRNSLSNLVDAAADHDIILNALSPCDNGISYSLPFAFRHKDELIHIDKGQMRYEEMAPYFNSMMKADSIYNAGYVFQPFLCIYATLIPRKCWEAIGDWDEKFETSADDIDYSFRALQKGIRLASALDALIWHFSGVTADSSMTLEKRKQSARYFKEKWGQLPPFVSEEFIK